MNPFLSALTESTDVYQVEAREGGSMLRPLPGRQIEFDRLAALVIDRSGDEFVVFPHTNSAAGWSSLMVFSLQDATT